METVKLSYFVCAVLMALLPAQAVPQSGYADSVREIKGELRSYQSQLETIERNLVTYADYDLYASTYRDCVERMDVYYETNKSFIALQSQVLFDIWSEIKDMREEIDEKIARLRTESETIRLTQELETEFSLVASQYDRMAVGIQQLGQLKRKVAKDTLAAWKNRDMELYSNYTTRKIQHKDVIAQDSSLNSLSKHIESCHKTISEAPDINPVKWGDVVFKVTIVAALLAFLINLIVSKKKLNNQLNGKKKKKFTPSI